MLSRHRKSSQSTGRKSDRNPNDSIRTDDELIDSILQGNAFAFQALMARYRGVLTGYLFGKIPPDVDLDDLMQEIYLSVYRNLPKLRDRRKFVSWLLSIARNKRNDALRERLRDVARSPSSAQTDDDLEEFMAVHDRAPLPSEAAQAGQVHEDVVRAMGSLPEKYRLVLAMRLFEERTVVEIAAALGIGESAARVRLHRGLNKLRKLLVR